MSMARFVTLYLLLQFMILLICMTMEVLSVAQTRSVPRTSALYKKLENGRKAKSVMRLPLFHRDDPSSPLNLDRPVASRGELAMAMLKRDAARVHSINTRIQAMAVKRTKKNARLKLTGQSNSQNFSSPVISGVPEGSGEFFTNLGVGTPGREFSVTMDTGSDFTWLQCLPCESCYEQAGPLFNPASSATFRPVTCPSPGCSDSEMMECAGENCLYEVTYGDGSFSAGTASRERFLVGGEEVEDIEIGCGHDNEGLFVGAAGLLGLGRGSLSFSSQIAPQTDSTFSYCLAMLGPGSLVFGSDLNEDDDGQPRNDRAPSFFFTAMLQNPAFATPFYYVPLTGFSIDGALVSSSINSVTNPLLLQASGAGGVILDSGTTITRLVEPVYSSFRDAFRAAASLRNYRPSGPYSLFDTCYVSQGMLPPAAPPLPVVELHFEGGAAISLPPPNYLFAVDDEMSVLCFAFASTSGEMSIIGNAQQQGFRISFDTRNARVGFRSSQCNGSGP